MKDSRIIRCIGPIGEKSLSDHNDKCKASRRLLVQGFRTRDADRCAAAGLFPPVRQACLHSRSAYRGQPARSRPATRVRQRPVPDCQISSSTTFPRAWTCLGCKAIFSSVCLIWRSRMTYRRLSVRKFRRASLSAPHYGMELKSKKEASFSRNMLLTEAGLFIRLSDIKPTI